MFIIPLLAGLLFVTKKVADFLNGLSSGGLAETLARFVFVQGVADNVFGQNGFPSTVVRETLKLAEFLSRAGKDPLGMLLTAVAPSTSGDLPAADSWVGSLLKKILNPVAEGILKDFLQADRQVNFLNLVVFTLRGLSMINSVSARMNMKKSADPVILHRGEFEKQHIDLEINGAGMDFVLQRTYRSRTFYFGPLGPVWDHSYNLRLRQENDYIVVCLTGQLAQQVFVRHPNFGQTDFNYFVPPNGVYDVLVPTASSFMLEKPGGVTYQYEPTDQPGEHRIQRIEDRQGNYLQFSYDPENRLRLVNVNSPARYASFDYDELNRISRVSDHTGRAVLYTYDDWGYLASVAGPYLPEEMPTIIEKYEYAQVGDGHKLAKIIDWKGRVVTENEYEQNTQSEFYGCVIRQRENQGETNFVYERIWENIDLTAPAGEYPTLCVYEYQRNGHKVEHYLNEYGNELLRRETYVDVCKLQEAVTRYRYNADGAIIAQIDPNGVLRQNLYGRDHLADSLHWPELEFVLGDVTKQDRMSFGNLLAEVTREKPVTGLCVSLDPLTWLQQVPAVKAMDSPEDQVVKHVFDRDSQLLLSQSDPRFTQSADPLHAESLRPEDPGYDPAHVDYQAHQRHLIRFEYGSRRELKKKYLPDRTRPSAATGRITLDHIHEAIEYDDVDGRLRMRQRVDTNGHEWFFEYFTSSAGPKDGFVRRQLLPQVDWLLNDCTPDILEIRPQGVWQASGDSLRSGGAINEHILLRIEGVRVTLYQSKNMEERLSDHPGVEIRVDGQILPSVWDQSLKAEYVITDLSQGTHEIEIKDTVGHPVSLGRVRSQVSLEYEVDDLGRVLRSTDACGHETEFNYNALGYRTRQIKQISSCTLVSEFEYDPNGRLVLERQEWRDENGNLMPMRAKVKEFYYDQGKNLLSERIGAEADGQKRVKRYYYNGEDNLKKSKDPRSVLTYYDYDALNRHIRTTRAACSADRSIQRTYYDRAGHVLFSRDPRGAFHYNGHWVGDELRSSIDVLGRPWIQTDPADHLVVNNYDKLNHITVSRRFQHRPDGQYELLSRVEREFDEHGGLKLQTEAVFEAPILTPAPTDLEHADDSFNLEAGQGRVENAALEFHLDAKGHQVAVVQPDGGCRRRSFDGKDRVVDGEDPEGNRTFRIFDGNGNLARAYGFEPVRDTASGAILRYEVFLRLFEYDELNREVAQIDAYGNRWEKSYDSLGNMVQTRDPLGNVVRYEHNVFGEVKAQTQKLTATGVGNSPVCAEYRTEYEYDANGNTLAIVDPAQRRTEFKYDALNRQIEACFAVSPNEPKHYQSYDAAGNVVKIMDRNGLVKTMRYDALNRLVRMDIDDSQVLPENKLSPLASLFTLFSFDAAGQVIQHQNEYCTVDIMRDSRGLPLQERISIRNIPGAPGPQEIARQFDLSGQRTQITYPSGRALVYGFDQLGRVTSIHHDQSGSRIATYHYSGQRLQQIAYGNGMAMNITYDGRGLDLERSVMNASHEVIWRNQNLRDPAGYVRLESSLIRNGSRTRKYYYDSVYRLAHYQDTPADWLADTQPIAPPSSPVEPSATGGQAVINNHIGSFGLPSTALVFEYDEMGNRRQTREPGQNPICTVPNSLNQYTTVNGNAFIYDLNGNLREDDLKRFTYDANNLLQEIQNKNTNASEVVYYHDALGRVIAEETTEMHFRMYDNQKPLLQIAGDVQQEFTIGNKPDVIVHAYNNGSHYWFALDRLNSVRMLTNQAGDIVAWPGYRPFGESEDGELLGSPFHFGFAGMWYTPGLPYYYSQTRSYRTDVGRFIQRDPAGLADDINLYTYAKNNSVNYYDPEGREAKLDIDLTLKLDSGLINEIDATLSSIHSASAYFTALKAVGRSGVLGKINLWAGYYGADAAARAVGLTFNDVLPDLLEPKLLKAIIPEGIRGGIYHAFAKTPFQYLLNIGYESGKLAWLTGASGVPYEVFSDSELGFYNAWKYLLNFKEGVPRVEGSILFGVELPILKLSRSLATVVRGASGLGWIYDIVEASENGNAAEIAAYSSAFVAEFTGFSIWGSGTALGSVELIAMGSTLGHVGLSIGLEALMLKYCPEAIPGLGVYFAGKNLYNHFNSK